MERATPPRTAQTTRMRPEKSSELLAMPFGLSSVTGRNGLCTVVLLTGIGVVAHTAEQSHTGHPSKICAVDSGPKIKEKEKN